jgi:tripeptide aminopeptidase
MLTRTIGAFGLVVIVAASTASSQNVTDSVSTLLKNADIAAALDAAKTDTTVTADQIRFCEIPAPPFKEERRAGALKAAFEQLGLNVWTDEAGNVLGDRPGVAARPHLVVAAHLDTVFPEGTNVRVNRAGPVLTGPGIGDNCRGLAVLVAIARALKRAGIKTPGSMTFVANVGEEGLGDLRGMKALFNASPGQPIDRFLSIDGAGLFLANVAVGSHRYRVTFSGSGGHSYAGFGAPNPIQAMGRAIAKISQLQVPSQPKTTFSVGRVGGGTSVNAIPTECWMEVDLRSSATSALAALDASFQKAVDEGVREENGRWSRTRGVTARKELVGDRPAGRTPDSSPIVQTALSAAKALGLTVPFAESSSDASFPIARGIPAITIGAGGTGTGQHTPGETFDTTDAWQGVRYAVLLTIALAGR